MTRPAPPLKVLTPELRSILHSRTDLFLLNVITANWTSQYASQTPTLAPFRDIVASHGSPFYAAILNDFRDYVPITTYDAYKPWVARFHEIPCKESRVENLFAPGLPYYVAMSSSTSGKEPKLFPAYQHTSIELPAPRPIFDFSDTRGPVACIFYYGYKEIKQVERESGHVVKRIPFCLASAGRLRMKCNWHVETDESRFPITSADVVIICCLLVLILFFLFRSARPGGPMGSQHDHTQSVLSNDSSALLPRTF